MSLKKQFLKSRPVCKVTFRVPAHMAGSAREACVLGDFNGWDGRAHPMRKLANGSFKAVIDLDTGRAYAFRYLLDGRTWHNDDAADAYVPTPFGDVENSLVRV